MLELLLITNEPQQAKEWDAAGVDIIFIDLEIAGKHERQGHLNTVISSHNIEDVSLIKAELSTSKLLVRVNPLNDSSHAEVEEVIDRGADIIMLPMFKSSDEVSELVEMVAGRSQIYPLIETPEALSEIESLAVMDSISGFHFGLNDLHLALNLNFMFEVMLLPEFQRATEVLKEHNRLFGVGGVARMGTGMLPGEVVVRENFRVGSQRIILSRGFKSEIVAEEYSEEIALVKKTYLNSASIDLEANRRNFTALVKKIAEVK